MLSDISGANDETNMSEDVSEGDVIEGLETPQSKTQFESTQSQSEPQRPQPQTAQSQTTNSQLNSNSVPKKAIRSLLPLQQLVGAENPPPSVVVSAATATPALLSKSDYEMLFSTIPFNLPMTMMTVAPIPDPVPVDTTLVSGVSSDAVSSVSNLQSQMTTNLQSQLQPQPQPRAQPQTQAQMTNLQSQMQQIQTATDAQLANDMYNSLVSHIGVSHTGSHTDPQHPKPNIVSVPNENAQLSPFSWDSKHPYTTTTQATPTQSAFVVKRSSTASVLSWTVEDVVNFVTKFGQSYQKYGAIIRDNDIDGSSLILDVDEKFYATNIANEVHRKRIMREVDQLRKEATLPSNTMTMSVSNTLNAKEVDVKKAYTTALAPAKAAFKRIEASASLSLPSTSTSTSTSLSPSASTPSTSTPSTSTSSNNNGILVSDLPIEVKVLWSNSLLRICSFETTCRKPLCPRIHGSFDPKQEFSGVMKLGCIYQLMNGKCKLGSKCTFRHFQSPSMIKLSNEQDLACKFKLAFRREIPMPNLDGLRTFWTPPPPTPTEK